MRKGSFVVVLVSLLVISACGDNVNNFDLSKNPLKGKIAGKDWQYDSGNGQYNSTYSMITGLMVAEDVVDPCAIRLSSTAHLSFRFPAARQTYNLGFDNTYVIFNAPNGGQKLTATSGFLEIVEINRSQAIGFISADFDDDNHVEGTFGIRLCN